MYSFEIIVGARGSKLSQAQFHEVQEELNKYHQQVTLIPKWVETKGDKDLKTSLRTLEKTDFFTKEIDEMLCKGQCRIAVHSAKDLPEPLPKGIVLIALTQGVDNGDSLVFEDLPLNAKIGTSSERREKSIKALRADLECVDIRGTIDQRLELMREKKVDGLVVAEAALIRLGLKHLNRIRLKGELAALQGKLAILAREDDTEMSALFEPLDIRKKQVLYLGLDPSHFNTEKKLVHYPVIKIVPREVSLENLDAYTHIIFTSKTAVQLVPKEKIEGKILIAVGEVTAGGISADYIAQDETQEGIVDLLETLDLKDAFIFLPRSSRSRSVLTDYLKERNIRFEVCDLYDTESQELHPVPDLNEIDEIVFTSPSTVESFIKIYGSIPSEKLITPIGPVTSNALKSMMERKP